MAYNGRTTKSPERDFDLVPAVVDPKEDRSFGFKGKRTYRGKKHGAKGNRGRTRGRGSKTSGRGKPKRRAHHSSGKPERVRPSQSGGRRSEATSYAAAPRTTSMASAAASTPPPPVVSEVTPDNEAEKAVHGADMYYDETQYYPERGFEFPGSFVSPEATEQMVKEQMAYYFSVENLCKDVFLRQRMDVEGYVPLTIVAQFQRMQQITYDLQLLRHIASNSDMLTFDVANDKVRLKKNWQKWLWPTVEGVMGVPLWTKVSDEAMADAFAVHEAALAGEAGGEGESLAANVVPAQLNLSAESKPFVFSAAAKPFVPTF